MTGRPPERPGSNRSPSGFVGRTARGQTTQDFAVGIGIFLLAIAFVFAFVPTTLTPFSAGVGGAETAQADRVAGTLVDDLSVNASQPNHLNGSAFIADYYDESSADLADDLGLRTTSSGGSFDRVNVTVRPLDGNRTVTYGGTQLAGGSTYREGDAAASASRIVVVEGADGGECASGCRLLVRVW